jgi:hypothetical protein
MEFGNKFTLGFVSGFCIFVNALIVFEEDMFERFSVEEFFSHEQMRHWNSILITF